MNTEEQNRKDEIVLEQLNNVGSKTHLPHIISHYLYFSKKKNADKAEKELKKLNFKLENKKSADGINTLLLATHFIIPTVDEIAKARETLENIALKCNGEYDGWEAQVVHGTEESYDK